MSSTFTFTYLCCEPRRFDTSLSHTSTIRAENASDGLIHILRADTYDVPTQVKTCSGLNWSMYTHPKRL